MNNKSNPIKRKTKTTNTTNTTDKLNNNSLPNNSNNSKLKLILFLLVGFIIFYYFTTDSNISNSGINNIEIKDIKEIKEIKEIQEKDNNISIDLDKMSTSRVVSRVASGISTSDGGGVKLKRVIGGPIDILDPFLLLDEFKSDNPGEYIAGFPDHPHRGFSTCTIMLNGEMEHKDNKGNKGLLSPGSVQWMTAGRGIVHSEMPKQKNGLMWGFQLWINLPKANKMDPPAYQDIQAKDIPVFQKDGKKIRVLAGKYQDIIGPVKGIVADPLILDVELEPGVSFTEYIPSNHTAFAYVFKGQSKFGPTSNLKEVGVSQIAVLKTDSNKDKIDVYSSETEGTRFLLIAGKPINEPIARYGPFVMNTEAEIKQAFDDFRNGRF